MKSNKNFENIFSDRIILRKPELSDMDGVFRYASDPEVTKYLAWPRHESLRDTRDFLEFSMEEWSKQPVGPLLIVEKETNTVIGSTGLILEDNAHAETGYVLAKDCWGLGFAAEALRMVIIISKELGIKELGAKVHEENKRSIKLLGRAGFSFDGRLERFCSFPNLGKSERQDVLNYVIKIMEHV